MIDLIPAQYRLAAAAIGALLAGLIGMAGGAWMAASYFAPQIAKEANLRGQFENAYLTVAESAGHQNAAIQDLHDQGEQRKAKARTSAAKAEQSAQPHFAAAAAILGEGLSVSANPDTCAAAHAASAAFDAELAKERTAR